jgi:hypothetical protein
MRIAFSILLVASCNRFKAQICSPETVNPQFASGKSNVACLMGCDKEFGFPGRQVNRSVFRLSKGGQATK